MKIAKRGVALITNHEMWDEFFNPTTNPATSFYRGFLIGLCKAVLLLSMLTSIMFAGIQFVYTLGWCLKFIVRRGSLEIPYTWWFNATANGINGDDCFVGVVLFAVLVVCVLTLARFGGWSVKK